MSGFLDHLAGLALGEQHVRSRAAVAAAALCAAAVAESASFEAVEQSDRAAAPAANVTLASRSGAPSGPLKETVTRSPHTPPPHGRTTGASQPPMRASARQSTSQPVLPRTERRAVEPPTMRTAGRRRAADCDPPAPASGIGRRSALLAVRRTTAPAHGDIASSTGRRPPRPAPLSEAVVASRTTVEREPRAGRPRHHRSHRGARAARYAAAAPAAPRADRSRRSRSPTICAASGGRMSSPLAIGAVSAVLRNLLDNGLIEAGDAMGVTVNVSAVAPDTIDLDDAEASAAAQSLPVPGHAQSGLAQCRAAVAQRGQRRAADQRAAGARPALCAHRLRPRRFPGRDPARLRHAPAA